MSKVMTMAKQKPSEPKPHRTRKPVELDEDLVRWIGLIVSAKGGSVPNWVNTKLRPIAKDELREVLKGINAEFVDIIDEK